MPFFLFNSLVWCTECFANLYIFGFSLKYDDAAVFSWGFLKSRRLERRQLSFHICQWDPSLCFWLYYSSTFMFFFWGYSSFYLAVFDSFSQRREVLIFWHSLAGYLVSVIVPSILTAVKSRHGAAIIMALQNSSVIRAVLHCIWLTASVHQMHYCAFQTKSMPVRMYFQVFILKCATWFV